MVRTEQPVRSLNLKENLPEVFNGCTGFIKELHGEEE